MHEAQACYNATLTLLIVVLPQLHSFPLHTSKYFASVASCGPQCESIVITIDV